MFMCEVGVGNDHAKWVVCW